MSTGPDTTAAVINAILGQLRAIDACGGTWVEADQIHFVRIFVEEGISELARADDAMFEFLTECAMLAGENMQDARLHSIEKQLAPSEKPAADFFLNLALMIGLELSIVGGVTYAVPAVIAFAAVQLRSRRARQLVSTQLTEAGKVRSKVLSTLSEDIVEKRKQLADRSNAIKLGEYYDPTLIYSELWRAFEEVRKAEHAYNAGRAALEWEEKLAAKAIAAAENVIDSPEARKLKSKQLQQFLDGSLQQTVLARVAENSATALTQQVLVANAGASGPAPPFQTSTLVGRMLGENRIRRNDAAREWADTRLHLRVLGDEQFMSSELAHELFLRIHYEPASAAVLELATTNREAIVKGFEVVLWLRWLGQIDALGKQDVTVLVSAINPLSPVEEGRVSGNVFVTAINPSGSAPEAGLAGVDGVRYAGLDKLTEWHGEYLYFQFAQDFFVANPKSAPAALEFDPLRYKEVPELPPTQFGFWNYERLARVAEMKVLAIEFFRIWRDNPAAISGAAGDEYRKILGPLLELAPDADPVAEFLKSLPPISDPDVPAAEEGELADPLGESLLSALDGSAERAARDAATKLTSMVTDLDLAITQYPTGPFDDSAAGAVAKWEAEEQMYAIQRQQTDVLSQYKTFLAKAAGLTSLIEEIDTAYTARMKTLTDWPPPEWQFPTPPPAS